MLTFRPPVEIDLLDLTNSAPEPPPFKGVTGSLRLTMDRESLVCWRRFRDALEARARAWWRYQAEWLEDAAHAYVMAGIPVESSYDCTMTDGSTERGLLGCGGYLLTSRVFRLVGS